MNGKSENGTPQVPPEPAPQDSPPTTTPSEELPALPAEELSPTQGITREIDSAYEGLKSGEPDAEGRLYSALTKLAKILIWHFYGSKNADLEHDIASKVILRRAQFRGESRFSTWAFKVAKNECRMALRDVTKDRKTVSITFMQEREQESGDWGEIPEPLKVRPASTDNLDLDKRKHGLPEEQVKVLELRLQGYTLKEISEKTETPLGTTASRYRLALDKLRADGKTAREVIKNPAD